jgi:predicted aspartyl protease
MKKLLAALLILTSSWVSAEPVEQFIPMQISGASTFYINTDIPGAGKHSMLVDTGSAYTVINEETLAYLNSNGQAQFIKKLRGRMADGSERIVPLYRIAAINLGGNCLIKDVDVAIMDGNSRQIIGISTLMRAAPFGMSFDPPILSLNQCAMAEQQVSLGAVEEEKKLVTIQ